MASVRRRLDRSQRRRACVAVLLGVAVAFVIVVATADGPETLSGRVGGDYPSFHAAGSIVEGDIGVDADRFYDPDHQAAEQRPLLPADDDGQFYFAYPAFFVLPYVGLATLGFTAGYLVHTALMAGALAAALWLLRPFSRLAREHLLETFTVSFTFYPMFRAIGGGQNAALMLLLLAALWRLLADERHGAAGLVLALLLFKPPLALPFIAVVLLDRRWRVALSAILGAAGLYAIGAGLTDRYWPNAWVDALAFLEEFDTPFNVQNLVSLPGVAEAVFGVDTTLAFVVGFALAAIVALATAAIWFRREELGADLGLLIPLTAVAAILVSLHALYYDAGLLVLAALALAERTDRWVPIVVVGWFASLLHLFAGPLGASPLVLVVIAAFGLLVAEAVDPAREQDHADRPRERGRMITRSGGS